MAKARSALRDRFEDVPVGDPGSAKSRCVPLRVRDDETARASLPAYAELAVTTNFSFLRGASFPQELVTQAQHLRLAAVGIADRNSFAGVVRAHKRSAEPRPFIFFLKTGGDRP